MTLIDFSVVGSFEVIAKFDELGNHVVFQLAGTMPLQITHAGFHVGPEYDEGFHGPPQDLVRDADDGDFGNGRMIVQGVFPLHGG